jgi:SAM-dependent methyltransferase
VKKLSAVVRKFYWSMQRRGLLDTLKVAFSKFRPMSETRREAKVQIHPFDLKHGVETSGLVDGVDLLTGHEHDAFNTAYWGVSPSRAREVLRRWAEMLPQGNLQDYSFIDVGCGKGRMLLLASELPFRQVIGVELNGVLASAAARNVDAWEKARKAVAPIQVLHQDATEVARPDGPCVFYLYNPFGAPVLQKLLDRLEADAVEEQGTTDFIYLMAEFDEVFAARKGYSELWKGHIAQDETSLLGDEVLDVVAQGSQACSFYRC